MHAMVVIGAVVLFIFLVVHRVRAFAQGKSDSDLRLRRDAEFRGWTLTIIAPLGYRYSGKTHGVSWAVVTPRVPISSQRLELQRPIVPSRWETTDVRLREPPILIWGGPRRYTAGGSPKPEPTVEMLLRFMIPALGGNATDTASIYGAPFVQIDDPAVAGYSFQSKDGAKVRAFLDAGGKHVLMDSWLTGQPLATIVVALWQRGVQMNFNARIEDLDSIAQYAAIGAQLAVAARAASL